MMKVDEVAVRHPGKPRVNALARIRKTRVARLALVGVLFRVAIARSATPSGALPFEASSWKAADRLFRTDPRWLGGDCAYSVDLGQGRVLWLFGDSFIARRPGSGRSTSTMVHNSIAIENGYDPSTASMNFYWRTRKGKARAFAPGRGDAWLWPSDGVRLGSRLLLFFTRVRPDKNRNSLGFKNSGWAAFLVNRPDRSPATWVLHRVKAPSNPWHVILGAAVVDENGYIDVFGFKEPSHSAYLVRWPTAKAAHGDMSSPEWWCGKLGWMRQADIKQAPPAVIQGASTEFTVQRVPQLRKYIEVQSAGFGASEIAIRLADRLEGPWSRSMKVYRPPESNHPGAFVYAGKAHPGLLGADVVITYVANSFIDGALERNMNLYFPCFVRLNFSH